MNEITIGRISELARGISDTKHKIYFKPSADHRTLQGGEGVRDKSGISFIRLADFQHAVSPEGSSQLGACDC